MIGTRVNRIRNSLTLLAILAVVALTALPCSAQYVPVDGSNSSAAAPYILDIETPAYVDVLSGGYLQLDPGGYSSSTLNVNPGGTITIRGSHVHNPSDTYVSVTAGANATLVTDSAASIAFNDPVSGTAALNDPTNPTAIIVGGTGWKGTLAWTFDGAGYALNIDTDSNIALNIPVAGEPPVVTEIAIPPTALGFETKLTASFTDSDSASHTASIDWGDGTVESGIDATGGIVAATHTYAAAGDAYEVTVTVTDDTDQSGSSTAYAAVYEPTNGFAAGAGWIPEEAAPKGKAFFGLVCRSVWWSDAPCGGMRLRVGDMKFRSTQYDWLVTDEASDLSWFAGTGTINGEGSYDFMVETEGDSIWITIFDQYDTGGLVELGRGRIRIRQW